MTIDEILQQLFAYNGQYKDCWSYQRDSVFQGFLQDEYPNVKDFMDECDIQFSEEVRIAGITVNNGRPILYLHPHRITHLMRNRWNQEPFPAANFQAMACLLWHESLHVILKHHRGAGMLHDQRQHELENIAQDILIDNIIHARVSKWRNWGFYIQKINERAQRALISLSPYAQTQDGRYVLDFFDFQLAFLLSQYLTDDEIAEAEKNRINGQGSGGDGQQGSGGAGEQDDGDGDGSGGKGDTDAGGRCGEDGRAGTGHPADGEDERVGLDGGTANAQSVAPNSPDRTRAVADPGTDEGDTATKQGDSESDTPGISDAMLNALAIKAAERVGTKDERPLAHYGERDIGDNIVIEAARARNHNLFAILQRYVRKINLKQQRYTWRKISKRQPHIRPGTQYRRQPGEIVLAIDTSGSMAQFMTNQNPGEMNLRMVMNEIRTALEAVKRVYGLPSRFYRVDVAEGIRKIRHVPTDNIENEMMSVTPAGGGTNYSELFECVLDWQHKRPGGPSGALLPDLVLFITDLEVDFGFMCAASGRIRPEYVELGERLVWLVTQPSGNVPPIGHIVDVNAANWGTAVRRAGHHRGV